MQIGQLAAAAGITTRTLRYYEEQGLLTSRRNHAGYRLYDRAAMVRVRNIRELLAIGFTLSDIRAFLAYLDQTMPAVFGEGDGVCSTAMAVARRRLADLSSRVATLTALRDQLAARLGDESLGAASAGESPGEPPGGRS